MFKRFSKCNHNQYKFENFLKNFKVQLQLNKLEKSPVQVNWVWKNFKEFSKFNSSKAWVKKIQSFKVQMPGCEMSENSENILSPNQRWLNKEKFQSFKFKNQWMTISKIKFEVQTSWDIFKLFLNIYNSTLSSMVNQCIQKVFEKEMVWNQMISFTNKIHKNKKYFNSDSAKF